MDAAVDKAPIPADFKVGNHTVDFLKTQKGYGFLGFDRTERMMHAGMVVTSEHLGSSETMENAAVNSTVSMIAAQQAIMCAVIAVSIAVSATASASAR